MSAKMLPHIILMLADDLGNYEIGYHNPRALTPNIDSLAATGVILERHYVYHLCAPTRASTLSGRLPYHVNQRNPNDLNSSAGVDLRMTLLPAKLKAAGYTTSMIGKSHLGTRSVAHLPIRRGFDMHFGFLGGGEDHFTQISGEDPVGELVDLWRDDRPAFGENGTFSGFLYAGEAERVIHAHKKGKVPPLYFDPRCADKKRQLYHGMVTALDEGVGNVSRALHEVGMLETTLIVFFADNGGPIVTSGFSGNNYPLKGGKTDDFEGGVRVAAFISGGFVPAALRGTVNHAYVHAVDWYATLCGLAGVVADDPHEGLPPIDAIDQWPTLLIPNATWQDGIRQEMVLSYTDSCATSAPSGCNAALIQGRYKVVTGHQGGSGFWTGPIHPNTSGPADPKRNLTACGTFSCCDGCLYDIQADPSEHKNLQRAMPALYAQLHARLLALGATEYQTRYIQPGLECITAEQAKRYYRGFRGPPCFGNGQLPQLESLRDVV